MAIMPGVDVRLLPENTTEPRIVPTQLIFHSVVGTAAGAEQFFLHGTNLESTFIADKAGRIVQLMDTERQADANFKANVRAGSVETGDNGDPDHDPWTDAQLDALLRIARFYHEQHGLPLRQAPAWDAAGYGYHSLFPEWSPVKKTCPGTIRIAQYKLQLLPAIKAGRWDAFAAQEDPMAFPTDAELAKLEDTIARGVKRGLNGALTRYGATDSNHTMLEVIQQLGRIADGIQILAVPAEPPPEPVPPAEPGPTT